MGNSCLLSCIWVFNEDVKDSVRLLLIAMGLSSSHYDLLWETRLKDHKDEVSGKPASNMFLIYLPNTSIVDMFSITTIAKTLNIRVKLDAAANCTLPFKSLSVFIFELAYTFSAKPLLLGFDGFIFILTNLSTFPHTFTLQL